MKILRMSRGYISVVDDDDFNWLSEFVWHVKPPQENNTVYGCRGGRGKDRKKCFYLHREIMARHHGNDALVGMTIDHIDGNGLNNQKNNLRICSQGDNNKNSKVRSHNVSGFKGVTFLKKKIKNPYLSRLRLENGKDKFLGFHSTAEKAAKAYDVAVIAHRGRFAVTNFPKEDYE